MKKLDLALWSLIVLALVAVSLAQERREQRSGDPSHAADAGR